MLQTLNSFINDMQSGVLQTKGRPLATGTIENWKSFSALVARFQESRNFGCIPLAQISPSVVRSFIRFLIGEGYAISTLNKNIGMLRAFLRRHADSIGSDCRDSITACVKIQKDTRGGSKEVFLNMEELDALRRVQLSGREAETRDLFLVGCYTCQRVSDFTRLTPNCFQQTARGTKVIRICQRKTRNMVCIPILWPELENICMDYGYRMPQMSTDTMNRHLRRIMRRLAEEVPSLREPVWIRPRKGQNRNDSREEICVEKWRCVSSHTARRSGITNLYLSGKLSIYQIMHISGHRSQKNLLNYIKLTADDMADEIASAWG